MNVTREDTGSCGARGLGVNEGMLPVENRNTIDLDSIRRAWANVSLGEEKWSAWLDTEILASASPDELPVIDTHSRRRRHRLRREDPAKRPDSEHVCAAGETALGRGAWRARWA